MVAVLHSNGQLRTERDGDTEKGCQKPALQQNTTDDDEDHQGRFQDTQDLSATQLYIEE